LSERAPLGQLHNQEMWSGPRKTTNNRTHAVGSHFAKLEECRFNKKMLFVLMRNNEWQSKETNNSPACPTMKKGGIGKYLTVESKPRPVSPARKPRTNFATILQPSTCKYKYNTTNATHERDGLSRDRDFHMPNYKHQ